MGSYRSYHMLVHRKMQLLKIVNRIKNKKTMQDFDPDKKYFGFDISFVKKKNVYT